MNDTATLLFVVAGIAALFDWLAVRNDSLGLEYVAKPMVIIALIGATLELDATDNIARGIVVAALGASLVGDVVLMTPDARFEAGLFAFMVAHGLYIAALAPSLEVGPAIAGAALVIGVGFGVVPELMAQVRSHGRLTSAAVTVYVGAVSLTAIAAAGTGMTVAVLGGAAFIASDALLGWDRFVNPTPGGRVLIHVTYHLGQFGLVAWLVS